MPSQVGRSPGTRLQVPVSHVPARGTTPAAPARTTSSAPASGAPNPHLSDYSQTNRLRGQIDQQARNNPSFYGSLVGGVNDLLRRGAFGISPASHQSVMTNLERVHNGTMRQSTAHFREARTFARDTIESYRHGRFIQGEMERTGVMLNTLGGLGMGALEFGGDMVDAVRRRLGGR
ncbi:hypothetical protein HPC49_21365 [Pyxidicoccus fallax]|uniref:Uncharacterized protein n=1 Tax=Pyxidicoccus fallax TaxID=394095 RepID=A0A848LIE1_9BACT|nr:hypothetical protein [Pyxidicoccus fallax]NMO17478.1 hypothetical protein [Pyxidicoccus fallax]NPC80763.1 hypothetical protein [Pyxidicoccus fallax]